MNDGIVDPGAVYLPLTDSLSYGSSAQDLTNSKYNALTTIEHGGHGFVSRDCDDARRASAHFQFFLPVSSMGDSLGEAK